jgi:hypothetical protein
MKSLFLIDLLWPIDLEKMLDKVKNTQWTLSDIDWDAPGRELVTAEQWPKLKDFMADLIGLSM